MVTFRESFEVFCFSVTFENVCGLAYETSSSLKMRWNTMFITAVCVIYLDNLMVINDVEKVHTT